MKSPSPTEPAYCQNFSSTLVMRDALGREVNQFSLGEPISFESNVTNNGASPVTLTKANGCPQIAFEAYSTAGTIVWSSADGVACTQATEAVTYAPGETKTFSGQWNQRACNAQSAAGSYRIRTQDTTECWARIDRDLPFTLQ